MKVVSFLLALLLPAHVTGVTEQYVLPEDSLKVADTLGQNQVADSAPIGPMVPVGGGKPKNNLAAKCKVPATYLLFVKLSDLGWAADLYLPIGAVVGGLPVYSSANGDLVGYLAETIIIGGAGCVVSGSIRLLATGANGFNDNISFEGSCADFTGKPITGGTGNFAGAAGSIGPTGVTGSNLSITLKVC